MESSELLAEGERQYQEYLEALEKATPKERAEATRQAGLFQSEYGRHSFAQEIVAITRA